VVIGAGWFFMIRMPGESYSGELPVPDDRQVRYYQALQRDVVYLAEKIGERNVWEHEALERAADWLEGELTRAGYEVASQKYTAQGVEVRNLSVEVRGAVAPDEIVVVGGHYDSVMGCPGANDNATGAAATLALAREHVGRKPDRTLRFVLFVNEEPPFFRTEEMGSLVYARACRERGEKITAMLALETMGFYSDTPGTQKYPPPLGFVYPKTGNFIAFVGNLGSRGLVRRCVGSFRRHAKFPSEGGALPGWLTGVGWSDHWAFWQAGYKGVMVTDTAPFRYPHYHEVYDTPDKIDYDRLARVTAGLEAVIRDLTSLSAEE
jgi:Zn-dependent M28 family amino/carboxypeptidase